MFLQHKYDVTGYLYDDYKLANKISLSSAEFMGSLNGRKLFKHNNKLYLFGSVLKSEPKTDKFTVNDLINKLQEFPQDAEVHLSLSEETDDYSLEVEDFNNIEFSLIEDTLTIYCDSAEKVDSEYFS